MKQKEKYSNKEIVKELNNILDSLIESTQEELVTFIDLPTEKIINLVNQKHRKMKEYSYLMKILSNKLENIEMEEITEIEELIQRVESKTKTLKKLNLKLKTIMEPVIELYQDL